MDILQEKMGDKSAGVHLSHCNQGEFLGSCKFGVEDICPAFKPQPDQSGLLTDEELRGTSPSGSWYVGCLQCAKRVAKAQRDLTAKTVKDEWRVKASDLVAMRAEIAEKKCQARIEALIEEIANLIIGVEGCEFEERLIGDKGCLVLDMNQNQWDDFKAKYTSKGDEG